MEGRGNQYIEGVNRGIVVANGFNTEVDGYAQSQVSENQWLYIGLRESNPVIFVDRQRYACGDDGTKESPF